MIKIVMIVGMVAVAGTATAQESAPSTWRDPDTRCVYLKVGDTLSLRYRRDGTPDCASLPRDTPDAAITRNDFQDLKRSIDALRRDVGGVQRDLQDIRRELARPR